MYDSFDNTYQVRRPLSPFTSFDGAQNPHHICFFLAHFQATIGIDFLSKTMYLEDRTVSAFVSAVGFLRVLAALRSAGKVLLEY